MLPAPATAGGFIIQELYRDLAAFGGSREYRAGDTVSDSRGRPSTS